MSTKAELRAKLKDSRLRLTDKEHTLMSRAICERLKEAADWSQVKSLHYYEPIKELLEPDISGFIVWLEDNYSELHLATTRKIGDKWEIIAVSGGKAVEQYDVILVPMLGFDRSLHRIGYGGGYYDKFLTTQPGSKKIGVCFEQGRVDKLPTDPHDIPLDLIATDAEFYRT